MDPQTTPPTQPNPTEPQTGQGPLPTPTSPPTPVIPSPQEGVTAPAETPEPTPEPVVFNEIPEQPAPTTTTVPQFVAGSQLAKKSKKKLLLVVVSLLLVLGIGAAGALFYMSTKPTPDKVFSGYLNTILQTKSVTQKASSSEASGVIMFDVNDIKQPKLSFKADLEMSGIKFGVEGYGNMQNQYIKYNKIEIAGAETSKIPTINKWVQVRTNGQLAPGVDTSLTQLMDPRYAVLGDTIFGNFSASDRAELIASAKQHPFLKYDSKKVKKENLDGHQVYVYEVTKDKNAFAEYNKKVAKIIGISDADVEDALQKVQEEASSFTTYIRLDTKQIVKSTVKSSGSGALVTNLYTDYNKTTLPAEPKGEITYAQFQQGILSGLGQ